MQLQNISWLELQWITQPLCLPFPPKQLFRNRSSGRHWSVGHAQKRSVKEQTFLLTRSWWIAEQVALPSPVGLCMVAEVLALRRDAANILDAAKPIIDSTADAIGINDRQFRPVIIDMQRGTRDALHVRLFRAT